MSGIREVAEQSIREAAARGDHERAATLVVETYGREVLGFLVARVGEQVGDEVFSDVLADLWRGLPRFEWRSTLRSWLYLLARHAIARHARGARRRRDVLLDTSAALSAAAQRIRTDTAAYLQTPVKARFRELRGRLSDDDQTLLILRIDRNLSWRELSLVMEGEQEGPPPSEEELGRMAARMRQRFQHAKERLRAMAEAEGLLPSNEDEA